MVDASQVAALLFQLKSATSPLARVRAVAQAWRLLRAMSPHDRKKVAMELGFEGAEGLVERVAAEHGGVPPEDLRDALRAAGAGDPEDVERLVRELRDPESRKGALQRGLETLESFLVHGGAAGSDTPAPGPEPDASEVPPATATPPPRPSSARRPVPARAGRAAAATEPAAPRSPRRAAQPAPAPPREAEGWAAVRRASPAAADRFTAAPAPAPSASGSVGERPAGVLACLARLRRSADGLRTATPAELRAAVEACGPEWARRRALLALIDAGAITESEVALGLIGGLASPAARRWCLNAFARHAGLDDAARAAAAAVLGL